VAFPQIARYAALGPSLWSFEKLPANVRIENVPLLAQDKGESSGVLYSRGGERTAVCFMHPRGDMTRHYAIPYLLDAGYAAFGQAGRWVNNDIALIHEMLLADVAAGIRFLRETRGFERIVLLGNSGGGALYSFYQSQAATKPPGRLTDTPAGDPYDLNALELPEADGIVQLATHLGQGVLMLSVIDPSVVDEHDPLSRDPELDMYEPANGYRELPQPSEYSGEFLIRYRAAQRARVARIDAIARGHIAEQREWRRQMMEDTFEKLPAERRQVISRRALVGRYMEIHRTEANPAYTDLSLFPSKREIGSFFALRPDLFNYLEAGFGKYQTPRAWLSTWSGLSSRAATLQCLPRITIPTLVVAYTGDNAVFSCDTDAIYQESPAADKKMVHVDGDHLGLPTPAAPEGGREQALRHITEWLRERFPAR
jgi:pimeloyl-ACP methyl ester carboxylesterase